MAPQGTATAGRSSTGTQIGTVWENPEGGPAREAATMGEPLAQEQEPSPDAFGLAQTNAEAELLARREQMSVPQPSHFPPFEHLSTKLNEPHYRDSLLFPPAAAEPVKDAGPADLAAINAQLAEILARMDQLAAGTNLGAVETKLDGLSHSFGESVKQSAANAERISRAAQEILEATSRMREVPARFEAAAVETVDYLGRTVAATASRAAILAAEQVAAVPHPGEPAGMDRLEAELRALNQQSRQSGERTAAALDRVHGTIRDFLDRGHPHSAADSVPAPRKRANVIQPIAAPASDLYKRFGTGSPTGIPAKPELETLLVPRPRPSDPNLLKALQDAEDRLKQKQDAERPREAAEEDAPAPRPLVRASVFGDEDKNLPLVAIVAFIMLLVSGALFYLHTKSPIVPLHLSVQPAAGALTRAPARPVSLADGPAPDVGSRPARLPSSAEAGPALFTAADQNRATPQPDSASEDIKVLEAAARHGDRDAEFRIGARFLNDSGLDGGAETAARWLARAADQGHTEAQFTLASLFERGVGVSKDERQAISLYRKAAAAGHVRAMHNLGVLLSAHGSPQDYREAASWFNRAALAGLADSQYNLALLYERGLGIEQDLSRAYFWYEVAAKSGDKEAELHAGRLKRTLPPAETAVTGERAGSWRPTLEDSAKSANRGSGARG